MRFTFIFLSCLIIGSLQGEIIGNVDVRLPKKQKNVTWGTSKVESSKTINGEVYDSKETRYYQKTNSKKSADSFSVIVKSPTVDLGDENAVHQAIEKSSLFRNGHKDYTVTFNLLKNDSQSLLYEWSLFVDNEEKVHGISRVFATPKEATILCYETKDLFHLNDKLPVRLKVLRKAKLVD